MNALAGGGSFVSLPALMAVGVPSVQANASSTVALFPGGAASVFAYREGLGPVGPVPLRSLMVVMLVGGALGGILLLETPSSAFDRVLPWLLLFATIALAFARSLGDWLRSRWTIKPSVMLAIQFVLGVYGGYFGGAVGLMMLAIWGLMTTQDVKSLNAPRTLLVVTANSMAVIIFIVARAVYWPETVTMLVAAVVGGYGGAQIGKRAPAKVIRILTLIVTTGTTIAFFVRAYF
jgi:uncharacterized membrane protein YfcA